MPIYTYRCCECEHEQEEFRHLEDRLKEAKCEKCGNLTSFTMSFSKKMDGHYPFWDNIMDHKPVLITSLKQYRQELKKRGLSERGRRRGNPGQWV